MRPVLLSAFAAGLALAATAAYADSVTSASGGGANVSIVTGSNGGTTIVVNSDKPCRTENRTASRSPSNKTESSGGSGGQSLNMNAGSLSGSTKVGPNGQMSVDMHPGSGGSSVVSSTSGGTENKAASGECVVIIQK